jgi:uncharacterized membrane protein YkoI
MTPTRKVAVGAFLLGSIVAGAISLATLGNASAAPATTATTVAGDGTDSSTTATDRAADDQGAGAPRANGITEEELSGDKAASVEAAVVAAYPDATIERMETDAEGAAYEAHVTLADGSEATVKLDASFAITATETGRGDHEGGGGGGPHTANGVTEEELSGDKAASVEAAVVAAYPYATIERMETDAEGSAYEAHITLGNGSKTTVKLDASFAITGTSATG